MRLVEAAEREAAELNGTEEDGPRHAVTRAAARGMLRAFELAPAEDVGGVPRPGCARRHASREFNSVCRTPCMRIGVDASCWSNRRGYGRYTRELLRALVELAPEEEWIFFLDPWTDAVFDLSGANVRRVVVRQGRSPSQAASANGSRSPRDMLRFTAAVRAEALDVFFCPSVYTYFPLPPALRAVVAVHDAIAERYPTLTLPSLRSRLFWRAKVRLALRQARIVLTVSDYSARDLVQVLGVAPDRIRVAGEAPATAYRPSEAADIAAAARRLGLSAADRWFVYVGGFNPHKRVDVLVRAHTRLAREVVPPPHLVLVGPTTEDVFHSGFSAVKQAIREGGSEQLVHWAGYVPDEQLRHIHSGAVALVLPSMCEGYGLPAVEAAACGTPVIATRESPLPTLLEGGGLFIEPGREDVLLAAMHGMLQDPGERATLGRAARAAASRLSWRTSAETTLAALREAAGRSENATVRRAAVQEIGA
ncbi:MAG: glycosyltransferase family 4 protein [Longimicrobiales bacterium]